MSYLDVTLLNDFQSRNATNEKFIANYGLINLAKDSTPFVDYIAPTVKEMMATQSGARDSKIPVLKDQQVTVTTVPGFSNIPINMGESDNYFFTAFDVFSGFRNYPSSFENNQLDQQFYTDNILKNVLQGMAVEIDNTIKTVLEGRKTQVLNHTAQISQNDGTYNFNAGTDTLEISKAAQKDTMFYQLTQLMQANQLPGNYKIVTSPAGLVVGNAEALKFGANNDKNLEWAQGGMASGDRYISDQIATSANFDGFLVRDGDVGLFENYPADFRAGTEFAGKKWSVSDIELPFTRMRANIFVNKEATDATAIVGAGNDSNLTMTHFEEMAIWHRFYIVHRYNSDLSTRQNAVVKVQGLTS
jgi:hypothetical protein